jgi:hypothetical protein
MSYRTHRRNVSFPPAGDLFSVRILTLDYLSFSSMSRSTLQNGGEVMVVDANHELFSHVGIIGHRTQVIQVVSQIQVYYRFGSLLNICILFFLKKE